MKTKDDLLQETTALMEQKNADCKERFGVTIWQLNTWLQANEFESLVKYDVEYRKTQEDNVAKASAWFSALHRCASLLDMDSDKPIVRAPDVLKTRLTSFNATIKSYRGAEQQCKAQVATHVTGMQQIYHALGWNPDGVLDADRVVSYINELKQDTVVLSETQINGVWNSMPGGPDGWLKQFGYEQFARAIEKLLAAKLRARASDFLKTVFGEQQ